MVVPVWRRVNPLPPPRAALPPPNSDVPLRAPAAFKTTAKLSAAPPRPRPTRAATCYY